MNATGFVTPAVFAEELGVDAGKILAWIAAGELAAINVAIRSSGRPRWRISAAERERFLAARQSPSAPPPRKRRQSPVGVTTYY